MRALTFFSPKDLIRPPRSGRDEGTARASRGGEAARGREAARRAAPAPGRPRRSPQVLLAAKLCVLVGGGTIRARGLPRRLPAGVSARPRHPSYCSGPPLGLGGLGGQDPLRDLGVVCRERKGQLMPLGYFRLRRERVRFNPLAWRPPACPLAPSPGNRRTGPRSGVQWVEVKKLLNTLQCTRQPP